MPTLSVKNIRPTLLQSLKRRAKEHHRSLQGEVLSILEREASPVKRMSPDEIWNAARKSGLGAKDEAVAMIRAARRAR